MAAAAAAAAAAPGAAAVPAAADAQQLCILQKLVHASERQWARLVIPGAQVPYFQAMQAELKAQGKDISIFVRDAAGTHTWRWLCRMTVQRPMILDLAAFYEDHNVFAGDTVTVWRHLSSNVLTVEVTRGPGAAGQAAGAAAVQPALAVAVAAHPVAAVPVFAAGQLPGEAWELGPRGGKRSGGHAHIAHPSNRSPARGEDEEEMGAHTGVPDSDCDYSPTAHRAKRAGGRGGGGLLAVRRALHKVQPDSDGSNGSDQESIPAYYTAEQTRRFDALLDVVARMSQSPSAV